LGFTRSFYNLCFRRIKGDKLFVMDVIVSRWIDRDLPARSIVKSGRSYLALLSRVGGLIGKLAGKMTFY
jgi:hypothetical protein